MSPGNRFSFFSTDTLWRSPRGLVVFLIPESPFSSKYVAIQNQSTAKDNRSMAENWQIAARDLGSSVGCQRGVRTTRFRYIHLTSREKDERGHHSISISGTTIKKETWPLPW